MDFNQNPPFVLSSSLTQLTLCLTLLTITLNSQPVSLSSSLYFLEFALPPSRLLCSFSLSQSRLLFLPLSMSSSVDSVDEGRITKLVREDLLKYVKAEKILCEASKPTLSWLDWPRAQTE
ncbi:hypothetical protein Syun_006934 [Stephania yunnanensis]|uniref:Uncharacterized protein n=1 Tax=Stephania yunnanensis TaxID=152371 RepID=A0AAP0KZ03_9MAGN